MSSSVRRSAKGPNGAVRSSDGTALGRWRDGGGLETLDGDFSSARGSRAAAVTSGRSGGTSAREGVIGRLAGAGVEGAFDDPEVWCDRGSWPDPSLRLIERTIAARASKIPIPVWSRPRTGRDPAARESDDFSPSGADRRASESPEPVSESGPGVSHTAYSAGRTPHRAGRSECGSRIRHTRQPGVPAS